MRDEMTHGGWRPAPDRFLRIFDDPVLRAVVRLQDLVTRTSVDFWAQRGVSNVYLPITTSSVSSPMGLGSDSKPVAVDLFGVKSYLADSMQFMLEYGCRFSANGAWYLMPSFRGEECDATHLNEFFHSEAEVPGGLDEVIAAVEAYVKALADAVLASSPDDVAAIAGDVSHLAHMASLASFERLTFDEAIAHLGDDGVSWTRAPEGWRTLTRAGELRLMQEISPFVWVTHFDHLSVPFYQAFGDDAGATARNADLLFGIGETVGCGERHVDGDAVLRALHMHRVAASDYDWYIQMKSHRPMRTAGFGMGVERWLMWVLGQSDIRELQLVPRLNGIALAP